MRQHLLPVEVIRLLGLADRTVYGGLLQSEGPLVL